MREERGVEGVGELDRSKESERKRVSSRGKKGWGEGGEGGRELTIPTRDTALMVEKEVPVPPATKDSLASL